jgi:hypothetical protein
MSGADMATLTRADSLIRKYAVDLQGNILYLEAWLEPGRYLAQRLDWRGSPLDSQTVTVKELKGMSIYTNLRESRAFAASQARKYQHYLANGGKP